MPAPRPGRQRPDRLEFGAVAAPLLIAGTPAQQLHPVAVNLVGLDDLVIGAANHAATVLGGLGQLVSYFGCELQDLRTAANGQKRTLENKENPALGGVL